MTPVNRIKAKHLYKLLSCRTCCGPPEVCNVIWCDLSKPPVSITLSHGLSCILPYPNQSRQLTSASTDMSSHGNYLGRPCSPFWNMAWALSARCLCRRFCQCCVVCCCWAAVNLFSPVWDWSERMQHSSPWRQQSIHQLLPANKTPCLWQNNNHVMHFMFSFSSSVNLHE